ncbi:hypothetical protein TanjilG_14170, partial [Lupinus angustifolius]
PPPEDDHMARSIKKVKTRNELDKAVLEMELADVDFVSSRDGITSYRDKLLNLLEDTEAVLVEEGDEDLVENH